MGADTEGEGGPHDAARAALEKRCAALTEKLKEQTEERAALSARIRAESFEKRASKGNTAHQLDITNGGDGAGSRASPELQTLLDAGADLDQINEELQLQQESIETYESLLEETTAELEAARDHVGFCMTTLRALLFFLFFFLRGQGSCFY